MKLVIVESPTKARKLASYLGKEFKIEASVGHVRDLPKKTLGVDVEQNFEPTYEIVTGKNKIVTALRKLAKDAEKIYLAMDPDREGEAIAWHVKHLITTGKTGKKDQDFSRSTFYEITSSAVKAAIDNPGEINLDLVNAQQARRILDRLVGYKVSPVLWKKVRRGLSAGRVQTPALRLIVEREREIEAFVPEEYWELDVALAAGDSEKQEIFVDGKPLEELPADVFIGRVVAVDGKKYEPHTAADVTEVVAGLKDAAYQVEEVEKKERRRWSFPPFTTSTLQQNAASRLGFTSKQTMTLAQQLYEEGLITYHRTDSTNLSSQAIEMARAYIGQQYGSAYVPEKVRVFVSKSKNAQEAHEAIRVTNVNLQAAAVPAQGAKLGDRHQRLYDLIWRRFVASQMKQAVYDQTAIVVNAQMKSGAAHQSATVRAAGSILKFDGWMKLFPSGSDTFLPDVKTGDDVNYLDLNSAQKFTQPPPRYNDASLVKELEKRGIGRPSTYASIISVLEDRAYVEREDKKFKPTAVGMTVSDFLLEHFPVFTDYDFTAEMEEDLDEIALGKLEWRQVVNKVYQPLEERIGQVVEKAERKQIPVEKLNQACPECGAKEGGELVIRTGRFGKFISCSRFPDCKYTNNLVEKVADVNCPLCHQGEVVIKNTRYGKKFFGCSRYPDCDWASWQQPKKGDTITPEEWAAHQKKRAERKKSYQEKNGQNKGKAKKAAAKKPAKKPAKKTAKKPAAKKTKAKKS